MLALCLQMADKHLLSHPFPPYFLHSKTHFLAFWNFLNHMYHISWHQTLMSKNYIVWLKGKENLHIINTRYVSANKASNEGDPIGMFISTIKNFIFDIALSTLWVPGEWQYQLCLMWTDILWWIFVCPYKEVLYLNIDNSCSYIHFF
jgi:hypothetical protein